MKLSKTPFGNFSGFGKDLVYNMVYLLGMGYMGGSVSSICSSPSIDKIFPSDLEKSPYITAKTHGIIQFIKGFPYNNRHPPTGSILDEYINWYIGTWAFTFASVRDLLGEGASLCGSWNNNTLGSLFVFYILPYVLIYFAYYCIPVISFVLSIIGAFTITPRAYVFALCFATAWMYALEGCKTITISCILNMFLIGISAGICSLAHFPWWIIISISAWIYFLCLLFFSPLFKNTPTISAVIKEILKHKISLFLFFMYLTIQSSSTYLIPGVTAGICICAAYILYTLW